MTGVRSAAMNDAAVSPLLTVEREDGLAIVTLNRPERMNALSRGLVVELERVFKDIGAQRAVRAVILTGAGDRAFCAGADLKERKGMSLDDVRAMLGLYRTAFGAIDRCPKPVVAAINGVALGGGLELALACDLRVAVSSATMALPETSLAIIPGAGGTQRLPRIVGEGRAKEMILLGRRYSSSECLSMGLLSAIANENETAVDCARRIIGPLTSGAPIALSAALEALDRGTELTLEEGLAVEAECYERTLVSHDRVEALTAFAEGRKPSYLGS